MGMLLRLHKLNNKGVKPEKATPINKTPEKVEEVVVDTTATSPEIEPEVEPEKKTYTRSQIQLMPVAGLKEVAKEYGIPDYENKSGAKLKKELLEVMGL